jgi:hypothetical protein
MKDKELVGFFEIHMVVDKCAMPWYGMVWCGMVVVWYGPILPWTLFHRGNVGWELQFRRQNCLTYNNSEKNNQTTLDNFYFRHENISKYLWKIQKKRLQNKPGLRLDFSAFSTISWNSSSSLNSAGRSGAASIKNILKKIRFNKDHEHEIHCCLR